MKLIQSAGKIAVALTLVVSLSATTALAEPPAPKTGEDKEFNFETDEVMVDLLKPDAVMVEVLKEKARKSLIKIRMDFIKEIVRSAEDI